MNQHKLDVIIECDDENNTTVDSSADIQPQEQSDVTRAAIMLYQPEIKQ